LAKVLLPLGQPVIVLITLLFPKVGICKWISNGKTKISNEGYLFVKSSRAGCLLKDNYWKDFKMSFEMMFKFDDKFKKQKLFGLIFRAEDLDNYFMKQAHFFKAKCRIGLTHPPARQKEYNYGVEDGADAFAAGVPTMFFTSCMANSPTFGGGVGVIEPTAMPIDAAVLPAFACWR
jgi:hypothetical protein